jgi:CRP/FNR family cyclic AMP-dependent transcriptional regulator
MKTISMETYQKDFASAFINGITFVTELRATDPAQLDVLMQHAYFIEAYPGEVMLEAGSRGNRFFFLLRGQLAVYRGEVASGNEINHITPGQCFGALSIICNTSRIATVAVSQSCSAALLLSLDLSDLGRLSDFSIFSLSTKLALFRSVVSNTRWQLELYKMDYPQHVLSQQTRLVEVYTGRRNTLEELQSMERQVKQLTEMLVSWNEQLGQERESANMRGTWL